MILWLLGQASLFFPTWVSIALGIPIMIVYAILLIIGTIGSLSVLMWVFNDPFRDPNSKEGISIFGAIGIFTFCCTAANETLLLMMTKSFESTHITQIDPLAFWQKLVEAGSDQFIFGLNGFAWLCVFIGSVRQFYENRQHRRQEQEKIQKAKAAIKTSKKGTQPRRISQEAIEEYIIDTSELALTHHNWIIREAAERLCGRKAEQVELTEHEKTIKKVEALLRGIGD